MGRAKDLMMQEEEQGWSFSKHQLCSRCISEPYLKGLVKQSESFSECSFCHRTSAPAVPLNELLEIIGATVSEYYNRAVNEAPYESAEGGYQGVTYDTDEVMESIVSEVSRRDDVAAAIRDAFDEDVWVERNMFGLNGVHKYVASWDGFCEAVKHGTRYFFLEPYTEDHVDDTIPVPHMLDELRELVEGSGLIRVLPGDQVIYRVRSHLRTEQCHTGAALGPPPGVKAPSNRMSAAGISLFYGAFEMATAAVEAAASLQGPGWALTGAAWRCARPLHVLDLSTLPPVPSLFETSREHRGSMLFLREFVKSITAPVVHDGREHIEYVPTQILTEYFRQRVKSGGEASLDGIVYPSARRRQGRSIVVFASHEDIDQERSWGEAPLLTLDPSSIHRLRRPRHKVP
jgi:hypothetical protein